MRGQPPLLAKIVQKYQSSLTLVNNDKIPIKGMMSILGAGVGKHND